MGIDGMDLGGLLSQERHHFVILGPVLAVMGGVAVPQDVMGHAFGDAGGVREGQDGRPEIA